MKFMRKALVFVAASTFTFLLFSTVATTAISTMIAPTRVKDWLSHSDVYSGAIDAIIDSSANASQKKAKDASIDVFKNPDVRTAVKDAFPPSLLKQSTENFIDGNFDWLEGKSSKPTYRIDLTEAKQNLATNITDFAEKRYKSLPVCRSVPTQQIDPLSATCRVPNFDISGILRNLEKQISTSKELFGNPPVITADSLSPNKNSSKSFYDEASSLPTLYKFLKIAPFIFGFLGILMLLVIIFMSTDKRKGMQRAGISLLFTGAMLLLASLLIGLGSDKVSKNLVDAGSSAKNFAQETSLSIGKDISSHVVHVNNYFAAAFILAGRGSIVFLYRTKPRVVKDGTTEDRLVVNQSDNQPKE